MVTEDIAERIDKAGIKEVKVRSVLVCKLVMEFVLNVMVEI